MYKTKKEKRQKFAGFLQYNKFRIKTHCIVNQNGDDTSSSKVLSCKRSFFLFSDYRSTYSCLSQPCLRGVVGNFPIPAMNHTPCGIDFDSSAGDTRS